MTLEFRRFRREQAIERVPNKNVGRERHVRRVNVRRSKHLWRSRSRSTA